MIHSCRDRNHETYRQSIIEIDLGVRWLLPFEALPAPCVCPSRKAFGPRCAGQLLGMSPTSEAGSATGSEDGAFRALEALVEDARRTCESRDARIASLLFDPPPALPAREPPDRLEGLQQQVLELQAVLQEKEASVQALRLRATFTQPEEARLESRRLLQESVRLQLELKAKRAQRASSSAKDADMQRLERLRAMHGALQEEQDKEMAQAVYWNIQRELAAEAAERHLGELHEPAHRRRRLRDLARVRALEEGLHVVGEDRLEQTLDRLRELVLEVPAGWGSDGW